MSHLSLPADLPIPTDDHGAAHLMGHPLPFLPHGLPSTSSSAPSIDLFQLSLQKPVLLFIYPRTGEPGKEVPKEWDAIPGARGCTPHLCSVRDSIDALRHAEPGLEIFGLSTQSTAYQREVHGRLHLPYPLLSDSSLHLTKALDLPTFRFQEETLLKRITLLLRDGQITRVDYPVFPPDQAARRAVRLLVPDHQVNSSAADVHAHPAI